MLSTEPQRDKPQDENPTPHSRARDTLSGREPGFSTALLEAAQMQRFLVLASTEVIGSTRLEAGDPPMGVAFGEFVPNERYAAFCQATPLLKTGVREVQIQAPDGSVIPCEGAYVRDLSAELGDEGIEVEALGIPYPLYESLFPEHVRAYEQQFK